MHSSEETVDQELRQGRLSSFGRVLAFIALGYVGLVGCVSIWLHQPAYTLNAIPLLVAGGAFAALWLLLRGAPHSPRFVQAVELATLTIGTAAFSTMALVLELTSSPDMIVRSTVTYVLLTYAVYVPSTARRTLVVASLMTVPLLGCIFIAFRSWDPALHDPPAATWTRGQVGDMAYMATFVSAFLWAIVVAMAAVFSQQIHGLRRAVKGFRRERLLACAAAGRWTKARAAGWWAAHRHQLRSGGAKPTAPGASGAPADSRAAPDRDAGHQLTCPAVRALFVSGGCPAHTTFPVRARGRQCCMFRVLCWLGLPISLVT